MVSTGLHQIPTAVYPREVGEGVTGRDNNSIRRSGIDTPQHGQNAAIEPEQVFSGNIDNTRNVIFGGKTRNHEPKSKRLEEGLRTISVRVTC